MSETENIDDLIQDFEQEGMNNQFLLLFKTSSGLKVLHKTRCTKKLKSQGCSGLASLFVTDQFLDQNWKFTNVRLLQKGYKMTTKKKFRANVGLEMAMSIVQYNGINSYWRYAMFVG